MQVPVAGIKKQETEAGFAVASGASGLLVISLDRARHIVVDHIPDISLVYSQSESVGGDDNLGLAGHKISLDPAPVVGIKAGVVSDRFNVIF